MPELACGEPGDGNLIVEGDNLVALKALLPYYAGQVMHPRLALLRRFLREDGVIA